MDGMRRVRALCSVSVPWQLSEEAAIWRLTSACQRLVRVGSRGISSHGAQLARRKGGLTRQMGFLYRMSAVAESLSAAALASACTTRSLQAQTLATVASLHDRRTVRVKEPADSLFKLWLRL